MKKIFLLLFISIILSSVYGQSVLLHKEVEDTVIVKFGPNHKNFIHSYFGVGVIAGEPDSAGSSIETGKSVNILLGFRYKLRLTNWLAIGYEVAYNSYSYRLLQDSSKTIPDKVLHDKEKLIFGDLGAGLYMRLNYGRRGNRIGNFVDFGGYGDWVLSGRNFTKDKIKSNGNVVETNITHLTYFNRYNYGVIARLGFNRYVFYGTYRLSDLFKESFSYSELPRITVGLQIGIHK